MWIFLNDAFLSVVEYVGEPESLLVRARYSGDIKRALVTIEETHTPDADYPYRAKVSKRVFFLRLERLIKHRLNYTNFKSSIDKKDARRSRAYHSVWSLMVESGDASRFKLRFKRKGAGDPFTEGFESTFPEPSPSALARAARQMKAAKNQRRTK